jgi:heme A synthase
MFATGDGLHAWPATVTPWIERDFPRVEADAYAASRQNTAGLEPPSWLQALHTATALIGIAGCLVACVASGRRRSTASGLAWATLVALLANAAIAGGLSGPHDRYQSRIMWLPPLVAALGIAATRPAAAPAFGR